MKKLFLVAFLILTASCFAQKYHIAFKVEGSSDSIAYIGQHYRDKFILLDTARMINGNVTFEGSKIWKRGVYALLDQSKNKLIKDFVIDDSRNFTITINKNGNIKVKGSESNKNMYAYREKENNARSQQRTLTKQLETSDSITAKAKLEKLNIEMEQWEKVTIAKNQKYLFFELLKQFSGPIVPDEVEDKSLYYRQHYWDDVNLSDHSLIYTPDLFNKMNYYFFGMLYHSDKDTICKYADLLLERIINDDTMMQYVLDFIMPKYYRSTKNVGWDATWCYLVKQYYLSGKCPWATPGDIANKAKTVAFLEKSLIGAHGPELWMADTNQSTDPMKWISSHRQNYPYIILWFWDPDCHHCQEQTATLQALYDSLGVNRPFEVYAVGYESDVAKWKRYVRDHKLPFINVGGPNVNIDYQEAYNVHGAPTMIILNHKRDIIMNKTLATDAIIPFLKEYEKKNHLNFIQNI